MDLYQYDNAVVLECRGAVVGVDEAGRGPLAGPVVAAAVQLDLDGLIDGIDDSKKLSARRREALYGEITSRAVCWSIGVATPEEIDRYNILQATLLAMGRALDTLQSNWDVALIDGNQPVFSVPAVRQRCVVDGDARSASIAAASIVAKVTRDRMMGEYHCRFPQYDFARHKGYATAAHRRLIVQHGLCPIHRRSFCERLAAQTALALETPSLKETAS
ncbi:MAG: ribonuclease HII [Chitinivibrionales bacterium]|nr:ribonuclease HII [Chitinivibrionales bacterium]MBD3394907.1 ribonuclease HII [Chitinivibrionales bacterium]